MKSKKHSFELRSKSHAAKGLTLEKLLLEAKQGEPVFITVDGKVRFVLMSADDGDLESHALQANPEFMAYLDKAKKEAQAGPLHSVQDVRAYSGVSQPTKPSKRRKPSTALP